MTKLSGKATFEQSNGCSAFKEALKRRYFEQFEQGFEHIRRFEHRAPVNFVQNFCFVDIAQTLRAFVNEW